RGPPPRRQPRLRQRAVRRRAGRGGPVSAPRRTAAEVEDGGLGPNRRQARTMSNRVLPAAWRAHAERNLPRYTSYPTAVAFEAADGEEEARAWLAATRADQTLSAYVHVPFCKRLCWYCGCQTSVFHEYDRVRAFFQTLRLEVDLWADAMGPHAGAAHLHFGGGSPNALSPEDFLGLVRHMADRFALRPGAEVAAELDPGLLSEAFIDAAGEAGVTRVSLGVQTFDPEVQAKVNRIQPFDM